MDKIKTLIEEEPQAISSILTELRKLKGDGAVERVLNYVNMVFTIPSTLVSQGNNPSQQNPSVVSSTPSTNSNLNNPIELLREKKPSSNYSKFAVIGYYLEKIMNKDEFTKEELTTSWKNDFKQTLPSTKVVGNALRDTVRKYQYLITGSKKGLYRLGLRGSDLVEGLPTPNESLLGLVKKNAGKAKKKVVKK